MQNGKILEEKLQESDQSIQRRVNMLGQALTNEGFTDVTVEVSVKIKGSDPAGSFEKIRTGKFGKYTKGKGPGKIGGNDDNTSATDADPGSKSATRPSVFADPSKKDDS